MLKQSLALLALSCGVLASTVSAACQDTIGGTCGNSSLPREQNCCSKGYCQPWNAGYYQCLDTPARCPTQETDIDYYGEDIKTIKGLLPNECCDECYNTAGCTAYTFVNENSDGVAACYLKKATSGRVEKKGAVSAKLAEPQAPGNCPTLDRGFDYIGNDLRTVRSVSLSQCCDQCGNTTGCTAYTYKTVDWDGQSSCFLKYSDAGRAAAGGVVSGKLKEMPAPTNCPKQEKDIDYYGNDIKTIKSIPVGQCCDACSVTPGCVGYTFVEKNSDGQTACYLKSGVGGRRPATGAVSGELKCPTQSFGQCGSSKTGALCCPQGQYCQPWNPSYYQCIAVPEEKKCPTVVTGIDFYGSDLEVKYGLQPGECCDACYNSTTCHVYTFINYREGSTACYLKSAITEQRVNTAAISGYKNKLAIVS